jgi:transcriptional regulator with XRE-family HTH domain
MRELGEAVGISGAYISRIEKDQRVPSLQLIHRFADHLGVSRAWLATGKTTDDHEDEVLALRRENDRLRRRLAEIKSLADETLFR